MDEGESVRREKNGYLLFLTASGTLSINLSSKIRDEGMQGPLVRERVIDSELERLFSLLVF
jgi:hypothetical protein